MKTILLIGSTAILSAASTLGAYKYFFEVQYPVREIIREQNSEWGVQVHNRSPLSIPQISLQTPFTEAANRVRRSVVYIQNGESEDAFGFGGSSSSGSGVIVSEDGYIISNNHVVENAKFLYVSLHDRRKYKAKIIGTDKNTDLALIKIIDPRFKDIKLEAIEFGNSQQVEIGQWALAVGNPFNLSSTVTAGIVSAKGRNIDILKGANAIESFIQTDAAVNPGNSGGALVNAAGQLIGINTAIVTRSGRYEGYSFAIPSNLVKKIMNDLMEFGEVKRGFLGIRARDLTMDQMEKFKLPNLHGAYLESVGSESAAAAAGLKSGDVILKVNGLAVLSSPELQEHVALYRPQHKITIEYLRDGKNYEVDVTLKGNVEDEALDRARDEAAADKKPYSDPETVMEEIGLEVRPLTEKEISKIGKKGLRVTSIKRGSVAYYTNMDKDFIITSINNEQVNDLEQLQKYIAKAQDEVAIRGIYEHENGEFTYSFDK